MKILHVPYCYYPDAPGGTEIYVAAIAREQRIRGAAAAIAAPAATNAEYTYFDTPVFRFATREPATLEDLYGGGDPEGAANFAAILNHFRPDILHLHARSYAVSHLLVRAAKSKGIPVVFTYHTPSVTCARGSALRWGTEVCDGEMRATRCAPCLMQEKGAPMPLAVIAAALPAFVGRIAAAANGRGGAWTALRMPELVRLREIAARRMLNEADHICAVSEWVREILIRNGVAREKITLTRQGAPHPLRSDLHSEHPAQTGGLKLVFLGRVDKFKGLETALAAVHSLSDQRVQFDVFAIAQDEAARVELEGIRQSQRGDNRICFPAPIAADQAVATLRNYDALLVPSLWLESGPLVVYEAFAAGIPVVGSDLGGIAELVTHGVNGILVRPGAVDEWARAIQRLASDPGLLNRLKAGPKPLRTAEDAARDVACAYAKALRLQECAG